jgi:plastocyanin
MRRLLAAASATGILVAGLLSCFSERATTGPAAEAECVVPIGSQVPGSTLVVIRNFGFEPASVSVRAGGTVTWVNCDEPGQPAHTSTADAGAWSSPTLAPGQAFSRTFDQAGNFLYHCEPHPFMTGTVVVQ